MASSNSSSSMSLQDDLNSNASNYSNHLYSTAELAKSFKEIVQDTESLDKAANYIYQSLVDDAVLGVFLETHQLSKTGNLLPLDGIPEETKGSTCRIVDSINYDIFGISTSKIAKKPMNCNCPNCDRLISATHFAPHLENCMGMGRASSRIASRRLATKELISASSSSSSSSYVQTNAGSDDEDDVDWSSEKRRKKNNQNSRNNGSKKNNGKTF